MQWFKKTFVFLYYIVPFFSLSYAADKDDNHFRNITSPKKSQIIVNRSPYIKNNGVLDLHHLSQLDAYKEVVHFITQGYYQSKKMCYVMTGRGNHTNSNGTKGVLRAKFPEWTQTSDLIHLIKSYRFEEIYGTYIVMLNSKNNYKLRTVPSPNANSTTHKKITKNLQNFPKLPSRGTKN